MTIPAIDDSQRRAAKVAGTVYLLSIVTVVGITYGVVGPLITHRAPAQAAQNILDHETLFRIGILGNVVYCSEVVVLAAALYIVLRAVDPLLALLAALGRLILAFTWLVISINLFTALRLLTQPEYAEGLPPEHVWVLARLYLSGFDQYYVGLLFWCVASTIAAYLWIRSGYVPRALSVYGLLASAWGAICTLTLYVFPGFQNVVGLTWFDAPMVLFEMTLSVYLLFRGLRPPRPANQRA